MKTLLFGSILLLAGCAHTVGYAGKHPGYVMCKGKGVITFTGSAALGAGMGGGESGNATIQADCGDAGFMLQQGVEPQK